jgi:hypothetical protein
MNLIIISGLVILSWIGGYLFKASGLTFKQVLGLEK